MNANDILDFWFREIRPAQWWKVDAAFDRLIESRFLPVLQAAAQGELFRWRQGEYGPQGRLAEIIVLDQFSRNVWRGTPRAFAQDAMALALSQEAVGGGALAALVPGERAFLL